MSTSSPLLRRFRLLLILGAGLLFPWWSLHARGTVVNRAHGFTFTVPDGFEPNPAINNPGVLHAFIMGDPTDGEFDIILATERMGGTIGREPLTPEDMPPEFQGRMFKMNWQGFEVEAFEVPERIFEIDSLTYNVQIPLKREAIQVKLIGPADRKDEMYRFLEEIVAGLKGESNWIPSAFQTTPVPSRPSKAPATRLPESENYGTMLKAAAIVFVLGGLVALWVISRKTPRGTVLIIASGIYLTSWAAEGVRVREVLVLVGSLRLLGVTGMILGAFDYFRRRKPTSQTEDPSDRLL